MARKSSNKVDTSSTSEGEVLLTQEEVFNVLKFAQSLYGGYPNVYTPDLVNSRLKDITMSPQVATADNISKALQNPKENEINLVGYNEYLELTSMLYKRMLLYFSGMMSFDWTYVCTNAEDKDYTSPKYKSDLKKVREFFDKFNAKESFKTVMREMMRLETFYGVLRDDGNKYVIQELPSQYCKITGRFDYGLVYDFNMYWFLQPAVSLDMYPAVFKKLYSRTFQNAKTNNYNPAASIDTRTGSYVYWTQTNPKDGFVAFKLFPEIATNIPFLSAYMPDAVLQPVVRSLQMDAYIAQASKIIAGQVPFLKDSKASVRDALALDPVTLGKFLALMKAGLPSAIKIASAPLDNLSALEFTGDNDIYDSYLGTSASSTGINSRLLYSKDRQNVLETKTSLDVDLNILRPVYHQFENMLEFWINQRTSKFKFKIMFEGFETSLDRDARFEKVNKLADSGIVLEQKFASAIGMNPFDFRRMLAEGKSNDFVKNLTPILKSNQMGGKDVAGRPSSADGKLSDSGAETREAGSNEEKDEE